MDRRQGGHQSAQMTAHDTQLGSPVEAAERLAGEHFGGQVRLGGADGLGGLHRSMPNVREQLMAAATVVGPALDKEMVGFRRIDETTPIALFTPLANSVG